MELVATPPVFSKEKPALFRGWQSWVPTALLLLAAVLRLWELDLKPAHFDEGINGWFVDRMTEEGYYRYDPSNYHGPLHFYILFAFQSLFGRSLWVLRMPVVLAGVATVWMAWQYRRYLGDRAAALAALALAIGPGFVFYQRYSIHESWLVLFSMLAAWGWLGICQNGDRVALWSLLGGLTGMVLTKETYIIHIVSMLLAFPAFKLLEWATPSEPPLVVEWQTWSRKDLVKGVGLSLFALIFFYSGNFFNLNEASFEAPWTTFDAWFKTGMGNSGHQKMEYQWGSLNYFWVALCWRYEPFALLGMIMALACLDRMDWRVRWLAVYGVGCLVAYSIIPYKTPWCNISIAWPFYLLSGVLLDRLLQSRMTLLAPALLLAASEYSLRQDWNLNLVRYDNDAEPYVYVQTYRDINRVLDPIFARVKSNPGRRDMTVGVYLDSYFPLPWILGDFPNVSYFKKIQDKGVKDEDLLICKKEDCEDLESSLQGSYHRVPFRLRSGMEPCMAYFNQTMFAWEFRDHPPDFVGTAQDIPVGKPVE